MTREHKMSFVGTIPFDPDFTSAMIKGQTLLEYCKDSPAAQAISLIWQPIARCLGVDGVGAGV
jgi:MinD superfamily P-loop ATPase